ncbi:hypothetical protein MJ560_11420 [Klebsiella pneumoniae]|nr:hypothetical protein MJ560_11420 [Klebsiella pneumoniae]
MCAISAAGLWLLGLSWLIGWTLLFGFGSGATMILGLIAYRPAPPSRRTSPRRCQGWRRASHICWLPAGRR